MRKMKRAIGALMMWALALCLGVCWAGENPRVVKVEVSAAGISTNVAYTSISDSYGWSEIDRIVVPATVATGSVTVALHELGTVGTNGTTYATYTETVATSGTVNKNGTYSNRPYLYRTNDGTNVVYELYSGRLIKTTVAQFEPTTNTWTILLYVK